MDFAVPPVKEELNPQPHRGADSDIPRAADRKENRGVFQAQTHLGAHRGCDQGDRRASEHDRFPRIDFTIGQRADDATVQRRCVVKEREENTVWWTTSPSMVCRSVKRRSHEDASDCGISPTLWNVTPDDDLGHEHRSFSTYHPSSLRMTASVGREWAGLYIHVGLAGHFGSSSMSSDTFRPTRLPGAAPLFRTYVASVSVLTCETRPLARDSAVSLESCAFSAVAQRKMSSHPHHINVRRRCALEPARFGYTGFCRLRGSQSRNFRAHSDSF